jgi:hypothetical protein
MVPSWIRRIGVASVALAAVLAISGRSAAACGPGPEFIPVAVVATLAPAEAGAAIATDGHSRSKGLIGWSYQFPIDHPDGDLTKGHHRIVTGVDLLPGPGGASWRGRVGYRYDTGRFLVGAGPAIDHGGLTLSPELGVKFLHMDGESPSLHAIARGEVGVGGLQGLTVMLGWNLL